MTRINREGEIRAAPQPADVTGRRPPLTVVVVPFGGIDSLERSLRVLELRADTVELEIVVPWPESFGSQNAFAAIHPRVRFVGSEGRSGHAALRALGCHVANGEIVALTEAQCTPDSSWCAAILAVHAGEAAAIGGVVEKEHGDSAAEWAVYLADYGRYMNPVTEGPAASLSDVNVSYKRAALHSVRETWADAFHEHTVHAALRDRGQSLWQTPALVVRHRRAVRLAALMHERFQHGRAYAGTRVARAGLSARLTLAAGSLLLPALLILRVAVTVGRKRRHVLRFVQALPCLAAIAIAWSWGELSGYVTRKAGKLAPLSAASA